MSEREALAIRRVSDVLNEVDYGCGHFITADNLKISDVQILLDLATTQPVEEIREMIEKLRAVVSASPDFLGGDEGRCVTCYHRNPDGPAAADLLQRILDGGK